MSQSATTQPSPAAGGPAKGITSLDDPLTAARANHSRVLVRTMYALSILVIGAALLALWVAYRYQDLVSLKQIAETRYAQLNAASPFKPAVSTDQSALTSAATNPDRLTAVVEARARTLSAIDPQVRQLLVLLAEDPAWRPARIAQILKLAPQLHRALNAHLDALQALKLGPDEYRWHLGRAVNAALADPASADGARYRRVLAQTEKLAKESALSEGIPSANQMEKQLQSLTADAEPLTNALRDEVLVLTPNVGISENDKLVAAAVDLFIVGSQFIDADEIPQKSPLRELLK